MREISQAALVACIAPALLSLQSCEGNGGLIVFPSGQTWVATEPVQCLGNPWEQDWLERYGNNYAAYPGDAGAQDGIVKGYYGRLGITVSEVASLP
jgi:hypothetical protein